jgi:hypothetical protein
MTGFDIDKTDQSLEITELLRASEAGYARDYRQGAAFGTEGDTRRLDAFTLGMLDALAHRMVSPADALKLLVYLHKLLARGPGQLARNASRQMLALDGIPTLKRYVAGGRYHAIRALTGRSHDVGRFARLLAEELGED